MQRLDNPRAVHLTTEQERRIASAVNEHRNGSSERLAAIDRIRAAYGIGHMRVRSIAREAEIRAKPTPEAPSVVLAWPDLEDVPLGRVS